MNDRYVAEVQGILNERFALPGVTAVRFEEGHYTFTHHPQHEKHSIPLEAIREMTITGCMKCIGDSYIRFTKTSG